MDIQSLKAFQSIAASGSFTRAAVKLYISQPALSKQIKKLEEELGLQLFIRSTKGVELTEQGERLLKTTNRILEEIAYIKEDIRKDDSKPSGNIILGCSTVAIQYLLPSFLPNFTKKHPDISFQIKEAESPQIISETLDETINCSIVLGPVKNLEIEYYPLIKCQLVCVSLKGKFLSATGPITFAQISKHPFVAYEEIVKYQQIINTAFNKKKISPRTIIRTKSSSTILEIVKMGLGVAIVPEFILDRNIHRDLFVKHKIRDLSIQVEFGVIIKKKNLKNKLFKLIFTSILNHYSNG